MDEVAPDTLPPLLDDEPWHAWGALGTSWMMKWSTRSHDGYVLVVTDGVRGFCERRDAQYVCEKAQEWAGCIEAEGAGGAGNAESRIAELVLGALLRAAADGDDAADGSVAGGAADGASAGGAAGLSSGAAANAGAGGGGRGGRVGVTFLEDGGLTLHLTAALHPDLPYCWSFFLSPLTPSQVRQLVIVPLAVQLQFLTQQLQQKDLQLQQLMHKLVDLTPDGGARLKLPQLDLEEALHTAAASVLSGGVAATLPPHLPSSVLASVRRCAAGKYSSPTKGGPSAPGGHRAVRHRRHLLGRPRVAAVAAVPLLSETEEMTRRGQIQALSQPPAAPLPAKDAKKKKLKI